MPEQDAPSTTDAPVAPAPNEPTAQQGDPADAPLGPNGEKALAAEREARKAFEKTAGELAARLKEIETANLSDLEKAQREAAENREVAAKATTEAHRWRAAAKFGISDEDAETFLTGTDEATILRQAETYSKRIAEAKGDTAPGPRPDLSQSSTRDPAAKGTPEADFAAFLNSQLG